MPAPTPYTELVERLGHADKDERWKAVADLRALGDDAVPAVMEGLSHPDWRVRRGCAIFADHHPDPALLQRLKLTLHDPKAKVRMWAVHSLSCEPCKPGGNPVDPVPAVIKTLLEDKSPRVRRTAASMLAFQPAELRVTRALRRALQSETDERVRGFIRWGIGRATEAATHSPSSIRDQTQPREG